MHQNSTMHMEWIHMEQNTRFRAIRQTMQAATLVKEHKFHLEEKKNAFLALRRVAAPVIYHVTR